MEELLVKEIYLDKNLIGKYFISVSKGETLAKQIETSNNVFKFCQDTRKKKQKIKYYDEPLFILDFSECKAVMYPALLGLLQGLKKENKNIYFKDIKQTTVVQLLSLRKEDKLEEKTLNWIYDDNSEEDIEYNVSNLKEQQDVELKNLKKKGLEIMMSINDNMSVENEIRKTIISKSEKGGFKVHIVSKNGRHMDEIIECENMNELLEIALDII